MRYSFDPAKQASNLEKHGLDLADAAQVIESGQTVTFEDRRFDYSEERFVTLGPAARHARRDRDGGNRGPHPHHLDAQGRPT